MMKGMIRGIALFDDDALWNGGKWELVLIQLFIDENIERDYVRHMIVYSPLRVCHCGFVCL